MRSVSIDHQRLLNQLFGIAAVAALAPALVLPEMDPGFGTIRAAVLAVTVPVLVGLWWLRQRLGRPVPVTIAFLVVTVITSYAGDNLLALMPLFVGLLLLVVDIGPAAGIALVVVTAALQAVTMTLAGSSVDNTVLQTVATAVVLVFMFAFALLLRHSASDSQARAGLIRERDDANTRLTASNTALAEANEQLRGSIEIEKELVLAEERARSARELHDGLGHRLTLVGMYLDFADRQRHTDPARAWKEVSEARETVHEAMAEMRLWVRALNPVRVEGAEGVAALDAIAEAFRGTGVDVRIDIAGVERPLPPGVVLFCHRFVQEGLTNALRHARARRVDIGIDYAAVLDGPAVTITLADDGGASPAAGAAGVAGAGPELRPGFGLRSLAERAAQLGGTFEAVRSDRSDRSDRGVSLSATIPAPVTDEAGSTAPLGVTAASTAMTTASPGSGATVATGVTA